MSMEMYPKVSIEISLKPERVIDGLTYVGYEVAKFFIIVARGKGCGCGIPWVLAEVVEGLVDIHGVAVEQQAYPEKPVAHIAVFFVGFVCGAGVFAENDHAGVHDIVLVEHAVVDKRPAVEKSVGRVAFFVSQSVGELQFGLVQVLGVFVDKKAVGESYRGRGVFFELGDAFFEEGRGGFIVALGNPDVLALCQFKSFVPLHEGRPAVLFVVDDMRHAGVVAVCLDDVTAVVGGAVVENDDLEIVVGLVEYRVDASVQKAGVAVIGYDY